MRNIPLASKGELIAFIGSLEEGDKITSVITPPEPIKALPSLPQPGHWGQCTLDKQHVAYCWNKPPDPGDHYVTAYHATGITRALHIVYEGQVNAGLGQSAGYEGMIYFFGHEKQHNGCRYNAYTFLNDESPYLLVGYR